MIPALAILMIACCPPVPNATFGRASHSCASCNSIRQTLNPGSMKLQSFSTG